MNNLEFYTRENPEIDMETQKVNLKNLKNPPASQASGNVNTK